MVGSVNHLVLSLNEIGSIPPVVKPEAEANLSTSRGLSHIKSLTLSSNNLHSWTDINALADHCPILETLNITSNPIIEGRSQPHILFADLFLTPAAMSQRSTVELSSWQNCLLSSH